MPVLLESGKKGNLKIKLKQSSAEMLCLTRYFGLIIGDKVVNPGLHWQLYQYLRTLVCLLTKPDLDAGEIQEIDYLVGKYNSLYYDLFGELKPKMHFLTHYSRVIKANGPAIHYSSLKFERENKVMKEYITGTSSNVELELTMAIRDQLSTCYKLNFEPFHAQKVELGPFIKTNPDENACLQHVLIWNKPFSPGTVCIVRYEDKGIVFGMIKKILYKPDKVEFQIKEFETLFFSHHYQAFLVHSDFVSDDVFTDVHLIPKLPPCLYSKKFGEEFVATRYKLI